MSAAFFLPKECRAIDHNTGHGSARGHRRAGGSSVPVVRMVEGKRRGALMRWGSFLFLRADKRVNTPKK
ncbi:MAG TPA: hypothetical protein VIY68_13555 [Steroidobacteraceae bacterium]